MRGLRRSLTVAAAVALVAVSGCAAPGQPEPGGTGSSAVSSTPARPVASAAMASTPANVSTPTSAPSPSAPSAPSVMPVDETGAVAWVDTPGAIFSGSPLPVAALPTGGRPCRASDLRASGDIGASGGGGHTPETFEFTNTSATPCILRGFPHVVATETGKPAVVAVDGGLLRRGCGASDDAPGQLDHAQSRDRA